ncbi:MAG: 2,3-bisphosphoglycerate-dependent phosphoglycerate mutase [Parachlamydiaceae bacterium]|nr:2,3-bisphosphoglycerate-dependent phosphoglycerate mutase [Parachlamydiaceae bacterium]
MGKLILMRHGESCWNKKNLFTGWVDVPLSPKGIEESLAAGKVIQNLPIDIIFTSTLVRAQMTLFLAMSLHHSGKVPVVQHPKQGKLDSWSHIYSEETKADTIPVYYSWELNERMYGQLQGLNKAETAAKFGAEQVKIWRRSYNVAPPEGESLEMTAARSIPFFKEKILPHLQAGRNVFIAAHGNSLRSICMFLDNLTQDEVLHLEIATGMPIIYNCHSGKFTKEVT